MASVEIMKTHIGLWIDHHRAVLILPSDEAHETKEILSHADRQPGRIDGKRSTEAFETLLVQADDVTDRKFEQHLNKYYDEVIALVHEASALFILGPGEAKGELVKRLAVKQPSDRSVEVETTDKLTDRQIATKVREHFRIDGAVIHL